MVGSLSEVTRETRRCWWAKRANSPRAWLAGVRASVVAMKRVMTVEPRDAGRWKCRRTGRRKRKPTRVPARASQWWNQPSANGLGDPEGLSDELGDRAKSRSLSRENPPTGKPDAGDPPVRFGGRGGAHHAIPTPILGFRSVPGWRTGRACCRLPQETLRAEPHRRASGQGDAAFRANCFQRCIHFNGRMTGSSYPGSPRSDRLFGPRLLRARPTVAVR
jgi:hypothetical protein